MKVLQLENASVGHPITRNGASLVPMYVHQRVGQITTGPSATVEISEYTDATVPTLRVRNTMGMPVLLVEGETVKGGRQNRTLNVSVLVPAGGEIDLPVSCVEQGRWGGGTVFGRGESMAPRRVRRAKTIGVSANVRRGGAKASAQGEVWDAVHDELARLNVASPTGDIGEAQQWYERDRRAAAAVEELVAMGPLPGQCGVVVTHGARVVAVDVFASADLFACHWEAVVRGHLLDAPGQVTSAPSVTRVLRFLRRFAGGSAQIAPGVGLGREHHVSTNKVVGQALVWDDVLVHASAFALAA